MGFLFLLDTASSLLLPLLLPSLLLHFSHTDGLTDRRTHRQTLTDRHSQTTDRRTHRQTLTDRHSQTDTHRQTLTDRHPQTDTHRRTFTDRRSQTATHRQSLTDRHSQTCARERGGRSQTLKSTTVSHCWPPPWGSAVEGGGIHGGTRFAQKSRSRSELSL